MPPARSLPVIVLVTVLLSGCLGVANMQELKVRLGASDPELPDPPTARIEVEPQDAPVGETVRFYASGSTDPLGDGLRYAWTFGDGTTSEGAEATHTYTQVGVFPVTLTVTDARDRTDSATVQVQVSRGNAAPEARIAPVDPVEVGDDVTLDASGSADPDGDPLSYTWSLGDGSTASGATVTHRYDAPGAFLARVTVEDAQGATSRASSIVAVELNRTFQGTLNVTDDVARYTVPVAREGRLVVNLTFNATAGVNDLNLVVRDAEGTRVASSNTTTGPGAEQAWEEVVLPPDVLDATAPGSWTLEVHRSQGVQVAYTLHARETFPGS